MYSDVIIIGAGAAGLTAGIYAAKSGRSVLILDHMKKPGKKILVTGNGKCNLSNQLQPADAYRGMDPDFIKSTLSRFGLIETLAFFKNLGICTKSKNGYLYPLSEQASSITEALCDELNHAGVKIHTEIHVSHIYKNNFFTLQTQNSEYTCESLIIAAGGCAASKQGSDGSGFSLAKELGHNIITPLPALVSLISDDKRFKVISGVRREVKAVLLAGGHEYKEAGEIIFTDNGISGIPVMQLSRFASQSLFENKKVIMTLDLFPDNSFDELFHMIWLQRKNNPGKTAENLFRGICNHKLVYLAFLECGTAPAIPGFSLQKDDISKILKYLKSFPVSITGTGDFEQAQVTMGGVDTHEVSAKTMESKLISNLYFAGEILDVDGTCGGYNLQWAWSSGAIAGMSQNRK